jgi:hypothetical protein
LGIGAAIWVQFVGELASGSPQPSPGRYAFGGQKAIGLHRTNLTRQATEFPGVEKKI